MAELESSPEFVVAHSEHLRDQLAAAYSSPTVSLDVAEPLAAISASNTLQEVYSVFEDSQRCLRLYDSKRKKEAEFSIRGILVDYKLPPVTDQTFPPRKNPILASQSIVLIGPAVTAFEESLVGAELLKDILSESVAENTMLSDMGEMYGTSETFAAETRYLTPQRNAFDVIAPPPLIDPLNILGEKTRSSGGLRYTENNHVEYLRCIQRKDVTTGASYPVYSEYSAGIFRKCHIVEAIVKLSAIPVGEGRRMKMLWGLRGLLMIDASGARVSHRFAFRASDTMKFAASPYNAPIRDATIPTGSTTSEIKQKIFFFECVYRQPFLGVRC